MANKILTLQDAIQRALEVHDRQPGRLFSAFDIGVFKTYSMLPVPQLASVVYSKLVQHHNTLAAAGIDLKAIEVPTPLTGCKNTAQGKIGKTGNEFWITFKADTDTDYDAMVLIVKAIHGSYFWKHRKGVSNAWWLPVSFGSAKDLAKLLKDGRFTADDATTKAIHELLKTGSEAIHLSQTAKITQWTIKHFRKPPRPYQLAAIEYIEKVGNTLIADDMGTGKTLTVLAYLEKHNKWPALVCSPKSVKPEWENELKECLPNRRCQVITPETEVIDPKADLYVTSWQLLSKGWADNTKKSVVLRPMLQEILNRNPEAIVLDESHKMKEPDTQQSTACFQMADWIDNQRKKLGLSKVLRLCLTGTPYPNSPVELISQLLFLGWLSHFGGDWNFKKRYCGLKKIWLYRYDRVQKKKVPHKQVWDWSGASNEQEMQERLRSTCMIRRLKEDILAQLPPKTVTTLNVDITNRAEYKAAEKNVAKAAAEIAAHKKEFLQSIAHLTPEAQKLKIEGYKTHVWLKNREQEAMRKYDVLRAILAKGKLEAFTDFIDAFKDSGRKLVVFAYFRDSQEGLFRALEDAGYHPARIHGDDSDTKRRDNLARFRNDQNCRAIVVSISAGAEGLNLQNAWDTYFYETCFVPGIQDQAEDRTHRDGQKMPVHCRYALARNSVDWDVWNILERKRKAIKAGLDGIKPGAVIEIGELLQAMTERLAT